MAVNPKVTAATVGGVVVELVIGLVEWIAAVDVPDTVEVPALALGIFLSGYYKNDGKHVANG